MDVWVLVTTAGLLAGICFLGYIISQYRETPPPIRSSDPAVCRQILACKGYNDTGPRNLYTNVKSRAIPNKRLIRAFNIDNSFTTFDNQRRIDFNSEARKAISMTEDKWHTVAIFAKKLVHQAVSPSKSTPVGQSASITLESVVRSVCLKIVLHVLFKKDPLELNNKRISDITDSINSLWIDSKGQGQPSQSDKSTLQDALAMEFPEMTSSGDNPLNLIIPAYETLWRVVLSGFLHVNFVKGGSPTWSSVLAKFLANPTTSSRIAHLDDLQVSVDHIVKEALRLYPSVKRVYRKFHMDNRPGPEDVAADIEACQRSQALWGPDAQRFVPSRWIHASTEAQKFYMAFGGSPFVCPAKGEFGPMMIGILVAAFSQHISFEEWHLELSDRSAQCNFDRALRGEEPLVSDRSTYNGIRMIRK